MDLLAVSLLLGSVFSLALRIGKQTSFEIQKKAILDYKVPTTHLEPSPLLAHHVTTGAIFAPAPHFRAANNAMQAESMLTLNHLRHVSLLLLDTPSSMQF